MSIDKKAFGISDSLVNAVNEALKGGQKKLDKNHNGKLDGQDFKMLRKEEVPPSSVEKQNYDHKMMKEGNPANKEKKNAAAAAVGAKNKDSQYLTRINPSVADKIRGREKMSGNDRKQFEEVEQVDEVLDTNIKKFAYLMKAKKSIKKSDPNDMKQANDIANRTIGVKRLMKKLTKEEVVDEGKGPDATTKARNPLVYADKKERNPLVYRDKHRDNPMVFGKKKVTKEEAEQVDMKEAAPAASGVADQMAARKDALQSQIQRKIAQKQMDVMKSKANKRISNIKETDSKCSCGTTNESKMKCEVHGGKDKATKGGREAIVMNPPLKEASNLPKKVVTKGHEIAKSLIKHKSKVDNPYAVGMAAAKKSAKMKAYRADRDKHGED